MESISGPEIAPQSLQKQTIMIQDDMATYSEFYCAGSYFQTYRLTIFWQNYMHWP